MISVLPLPAARAARMNSRGHSASAPARATRAKTGMLKMPMAMMALIAPGPKIAVIMIAESSAGKGEDDVVEAHQRLVEQAAARRGPGAERHADAHADADRDQRHGDRVPGADHHHRQDVAAEMVGAEPVRGGRRLQLVGDDQPGHVVGRPEQARRRAISDDRHGDQEADQERAAGEAPWRRSSPPSRVAAWRPRSSRALRRGSTIA